MALLLYDGFTTLQGLYYCRTLQWLYYSAGALLLHNVQVRISRICLIKDASLLAAYAGLYAFTHRNGRAA